MWAAYDRSVRQEVAVKILHERGEGGDERVERFYRGARLMQQINHPNVVRVMEAYGFDDGYRFIVMELMSGGDYGRRLNKAAYPLRRC